jgi:predicted MFS family arabinose efflux permease
MKSLRRILVFTFVEDFAGVMVTRGMTFFAHQALEFSSFMNLCLVLTFGAMMIAGAGLSHRLSQRIGEKRLICGVLVGQVAVCVVLAAFPIAVVVFAASAVIGILHGLKWPVVESYVSAGRSPRETARAVGMFNVAWAGSIPLAVMVTGPIIHAWKPGLFVLTAVIHLCSLWIIRSLPAAPAHMASDHPDRPEARQIPRMVSLLAASRFMLFSTCAAMYILAALMPHIFESLGFSVSTATSLAAPLDVARVVTFVILQRWSGWHDRGWPIVLVIVAMPVGFFLIVPGGSLTAVLVGEVLFGAAFGVAYYASLYYAMVVQNAAVHAGGAHEQLIGLGFALGPLVGLAGQGLTESWHDPMLGYLATAGVLIMLAGAGATRSLARARRAALGGDGQRESEPLAK